MDRQLCLTATGEIGVREVQPTRHHLDPTSWVDLAPGWLAGADDVFDTVAPTMRWRHGRRAMYGRVVDEPRLTASSGTGPGEAPHPVPEIADALARTYGRPLRHLWANWYRDGDDAVAWHSDRVRLTESDPMVAIVSLGGPRPFLLRPRGGGRTVRLLLHSGDLLVMGGACQHRWEHTVPRVRNGAPRISLTFRVPGPGTRAPTVQRWSEAAPSDQRRR